MAIVTTFKLERGNVVFKHLYTDKPREHLTHWGSGLFDGPEYITIAPQGISITIRDELSTDHGTGVTLGHKEPTLFLINGCDFIDQWTASISKFKKT